MLLKETLYVRPRANTMQAKHALHNIGVLKDKVYQAYHIFNEGANVHIGVVGEEGYLFHMPAFCWLIVDSKTKQPINKQKEVTDANSN